MCLWRNDGSIVTGTGVKRIIVCEGQEKVTIERPENVYGFGLHQYISLTVRRL